MKKVTITNVSAVESREEWLALRARHITATDWPKITGTSRWGSASDVRWDKLYPEAAGDWEPTLPMRVGTGLEPLIFARMLEILGPGEYLSQEFVSRRHLGFTPDLIRLNQAEDWQIVEIKVSVKDWGGVVPADHLDQVRFQATVLGLDHVMVAHLKLQSWQEGFKLIRLGEVATERLDLYRVEVCERERTSIERKAERWWKRHILDGEAV